MRATLVSAALALSTLTVPAVAFAQTAPAEPPLADQPVTTGSGTGESGAPPGQPGGIREQPAAAAQHTPGETTAGAKVDLLSRLDPELFGYVKLGYFFVTSPSNDALVGSNSGFRLVNARIGVSLHPAKDLEAVISIDGAAPMRRDLDPLEGSRVVALRDGYLDYRVSPYLRIRGGQFKAPFNAEVLLPDDALPFISRSIVSEGVLPPEGFARSGLSLDRQIGLQISSDRLGGDVGVQYAVALVNGNGANVLNNDNNSVTPVARLSAGYRDLVTVGANGFYNSATYGERPVRIDETRLGYGGDVTVNVAGVNAFAMVLFQSLHHLDVGIPDEQAMGIVAQAKYVYEPVGIEAGVRFDRLEPSDVQTNDMLTEIIGMVGYRVKGFPARILAQYTHRIEEPGASIDNDSVDALAQITF
ncbi:MAG: hypothetical protein IRZ16_16900 [Myxococcaceae bacterium]|nr:hypothetical protein [Myxococcaceae bacterium]